MRRISFNTLVSSVTVLSMVFILTTQWSVLFTADQESSNVIVFQIQPRSINKQNTNLEPRTVSLTPEMIISRDELTREVRISAIEPQTNTPDPKLAVASSDRTLTTASVEDVIITAIPPTSATIKKPTTIPTAPRTQKPTPRPTTPPTTPPPPPTTTTTITTTQTQTTTKAPTKVPTLKPTTIVLEPCATNYSSLLLNQPPNTLYYTTPIEPPTSERPDVYTFRIVPLPEFGCSARCREGPVCSGMSFFEVLVHGPRIWFIGSITPAAEDAGVFWQVDIRIPRGYAGTYNVETRILFHNFQRAYDDYRDRAEFIRMMTHPQFAATFPKSIINRRLSVSNSSSTTIIVPVQPDVKAASLRAALPLCSETRPSPTLLGYWDQQFENFFPYDCRLMSLRPSAAEGSADKQVLLNAMSGRWIAFFGDSNARGMFYHMCKLVGAKNYAKQPKGDMGKGDKLHACFDHSFLITETIWWPTAYPQLSVIIKRHANEIFAEAGMRDSVALMTATELWNRPHPDMVIISMGSHDNHFVSKQGKMVYDLIKLGMPELLENGCKKLMFISATATNPELIPSSVFGANSSFLIQNNPRVQRINLSTQTAFSECKHIDLFTLSMAPYMKNFVTNSDTLKPNVLDMASDIILNYLVTDKR